MLKLYSKKKKEKDLTLADTEPSKHGILKRRLAVDNPYVQKKGNWVTPAPKLWAPLFWLVETTRNFGHDVIPDMQHQWLHLIVLAKTNIRWLQFVDSPFLPKIDQLT